MHKSVEVPMYVLIVKIACEFEISQKEMKFMISMFYYFFHVFSLFNKCTCMLLILPKIFQIPHFNACTLKSACCIIILLFFRENHCSPIELK